MNYAHKSDNIETMMGSKIDKVIEEIFESLLQGYQEGLVDSVDVLYYNLNKISLNRSLKA